MIEGALASIEAGTPRLAGAARPLTPPHWNRPPAGRRGRDLHARAARSRRSTVPTPPTRGPSRPSHSVAASGSANAAHARTLEALAGHLKAWGFAPESNHLIDLYRRLTSGPAIFEVKSVTSENERAQCRHALSQLYEYRFLHSVPTASLWVVLSTPPSAEWLVDYLRQDRGVDVLWIEEGRIGGPDADRLAESGSAARRRG